MSSVILLQVWIEGQFKDRLCLVLETTVSMMQQILADYSDLPWQQAVTMICLDPDRRTLNTALGFGWFVDKSTRQR